MALTLFDHKKKRITQTSVEGEGGISIGVYHTNHEMRRVGESPYDLLFSIDTRTVFTASWGLPPTLPIIYRTRDPTFEPFAYRVRADSMVDLLASNELLDLGELQAIPGELLRGKLLPYNPKKAEDALAWAGVFSLRNLSRSEMRRAIEIGNQRWGDDWTPYRICPYPENVSKAAILRMEWNEPFCQNASFPCLAPESRCDRGIFAKEVLPLALYEVDSDINLFGNFNPQLIVTYCRRCKTIGIENQCD